MGCSGTRRPFIIGNGTNYLPDGGYVHNGVLEFFLTVGIPLGGIFILVFVYLIGKGFINSFVVIEGFLFILLFFRIFSDSILFLFVF